MDHRTGISSGTARQQGPRWRQPEGQTCTYGGCLVMTRAAACHNGPEAGARLCAKCRGANRQRTIAPMEAWPIYFFWAIPLGIVRSRQRAFLTGGCRWRDTALGRAFSSPARCSVGSRPRINIGPQQNTVQGYSAPLGATLPPPQAADFHPAKSRLYQQYQSD